MYSFEQECFAKGYRLVCGVDEAGRGPLAGPVCAAAVILDPNQPIAGLNDSKKLSEKKREALFPQIMDKALAYNICMVDAQTIDDINILQATMQAMAQAVNGLLVKPDFVLIDGNKCPDFADLPAMAIVGGDGKSASIAAASILAKVTRDHYMQQLGEAFPQYGFATHKGYGTKAHYGAIAQHGICPEHRKTFLKSIGYGTK